MLLKAAPLPLLLALICAPAETFAGTDRLMARSDDAQAAATGHESAHAQALIMHVTIGTHRFAIDLADTQAAAELRALLPLELPMQDHLRNEKHADLPHALSRSDSRPGRIEAGDLMLWEGKTLVVFYESFDSPYRYTRLGRIRQVHNLKAAVGTGSVRMRFSAR